MTTQYTPILKLALPVTGELSGTWGNVVNDNITSMIEQAIAGLTTVNTWTANSHTLTTANGTTSESRCAMLVLADGSGGTALTGAGEVICPASSKLYVMKNGSSYSVTLKTASGTGIAVASGETAFLFCDGVNVNSCVTTLVNGRVTGNLTVDGNATVNGNTTLGNATSDTVTFTGRVASNLLPSADNTYDLGSAANSWKGLWIDGTATMALVAISGGTINGASITGLSNPTNTGDAANKGYVDTGLAAKLDLAGGTMTGNITFNPGQSFPGVATYPGAGVPVSTGSAWAASLTAPSGALVGTTDSQTLSNKTLSSPVVNGTFSGTAVIPVANGGLNLTGIAALSIPVANTLNTYTTVTPAAGQSIRINAGNTAWEAYTPTFGTVTSVSWTGGIVSVATGTSTPAFTIAGTSGGIPYFSSASTWASSGALAANAIVIGGGAGAAPSTTTTGTGVLTALGNNTNTASGVVTGTGAATLQNKRIDPRVSSTTSTASISPDISAFDQYCVTAQAATLTINAPTGTPVDGDKLIFRILDNGSPQTISWNGTYTVIGTTLPTTTTANKMIYVGCIYNAANTRWDVVAVTTQV